MSSKLINQVLELTNVERAKAGLQPLTLNNQLAQAAQGHSGSMAEDDFFSHTGADGSNVGDRVSDKGYNFATTGENIAAGQTTAEQVVESWMNSPGHRANILNPDYTEIGIGYELLENDTGSVNYNHYWTQVFGSQQGGGTTPVSTPQSPTLETNSDPIIIEDNSSNIPEPDSKDTLTTDNSTPVQPLQPKNALNNDAKVPQMDELIKTEVPVTETKKDLQVETLDSDTADLESSEQIDELIKTEVTPVTETKKDLQVETLDSNTADLESPKENKDSLGEDSDLSLFGSDIGNLNADEAMDYGDDLTGSSDNMAMTGGDDAIISSEPQAYSYSSSSSSSSSNGFAYTDSNYDFAGVAEMLKGSWLGTSESSLDQYESDLIETISNSDLNSSQQQKAIETVKSFF